MGGEKGREGILLHHEMLDPPLSSHPLRTVDAQCRQSIAVHY